MPDLLTDPDGGVTRLVIVTGMSGAGRSTAAHVLEDEGWFVVDNLPPQMLSPLAELALRAGDTIPRLAAVVDVRGRAFFVALTDALEDVRAKGVDLVVLFLEADDATLVRR
ncbi:MAG: RNase adapter RapZ, partial [Actinomycetales bacterium]